MLFGEIMPICDEKEGVNSVFRYSLLTHRLASLTQPGWVPSITERGFLVEDVSNVLMGMLSVARMQEVKEAQEELGMADISCFNCQQLVEDKKEWVSFVVDKLINFFTIENFHFIMDKALVKT
jgi:hypothetical protein